MTLANLSASRSALSRRPKRRLLAKLSGQPLFFWSFAIIAGALTFWSITASIKSTREAAEAYGHLVPVVVATRNLEPGELIGPSTVEVSRLPGSLVPPGALNEIPIGQAVRSFIAAGEAVVTERLAPLGVHGMAASLYPDERAIAVPTERNRLRFEVGMNVDVLQTLDPFSVGAGTATSVLVEAARVIAVEESAITVAVPTNRVNRVATALASAVVTLVITPQ